MVRVAHAVGRSCAEIPYVWRAHANTMIAGSRKPDIVLVSSLQKSQPRVGYADIRTYCELKSSESDPCDRQARKQVTEIATFTSSIQFHRRFFVGMTLCGFKLSLAIYIRGCTVFTHVLDINQCPRDFIVVILGLSTSSPTWNGFDQDVIRCGDESRVVVGGVEVSSNTLFK